MPDGTRTRAANAEYEFSMTKDSLQLPTTPVSVRYSRNNSRRLDQVRGCSYHRKSSWIVSITCPGAIMRISTLSSEECRYVVTAPGGRSHRCRGPHGPLRRGSVGPNR